MALPINLARGNRLAAGLPRGGRGPAGAPLSVDITVQGWNAVVEHWAASMLMLDAGAMGIVQVTGEFIAGVAKEFHRPHVDTGATIRSIGHSDKGPVYPIGFGGWAVDVGPETRQARFLEWGFTHTQSGRFIQYPFMVPASDAVRPIFFNAMTQLVEMAASRRNVTNPIAEAAGFADSFRSALYSSSKAAGDLAALGFGGLSGFRTGALFTARVIGDLDSVLRSALTTRIFHRVSGRFSSGSLTARTDAIVSGPTSEFSSTGQRIYNRFSGAELGRGFGSFRF